MIVLYMIGISLGAMKAVEIYQELLGRIGVYNTAAWWKSFLACGFSGGASVLLVNGWQNQVLVGLGAAGLSALFHTVESGIRHWRDVNMQIFVLRETQGRSRNRLV